MELLTRLKHTGVQLGIFYACEKFPLTQSHSRIHTKQGKLQRDTVLRRAKLKNFNRQFFASQNVQLEIKPKMFQTEPAINMKLFAYSVNLSNEDNAPDSFRAKNAATCHFVGSCWSGKKQIRKKVGPIQLCKIMLIKVTTIRWVSSCTT